MNPTTLLAMGDELTKIAGLRGRDQDFIRDRSRQAGKLASASLKKLYKSQGAAGRGAIIGGITGAVKGVARGMTRYNPEFDYETGQFKKPTVGTRIKRVARDVVTETAMGAALGAGTGHLIRKLDG